MTVDVFATEAPAYWNRGLSVLPTGPGTKQPEKSIAGWSGYLSSPPNADTRADWRQKYATSGIALLLGGEVIKGWALVGIDVDDDRLLPIAEVLIGPTVAGKRGKKGATHFVLMPSKPKVKATTLKGFGALGNIDVLAGGRITVMEPTVHPETQSPYVAVGKRLIDTPFESLPRAETDALKLLGMIVGSEQAETLLSGKATHDAGVSFTAKLVKAGAGDDEIRMIFTALLPKGYSGNSLDELAGWIESARNKEFLAPDQEPKSDSLTALLVTLAVEGGVKLFHDSDRNAYASIPTDGGAQNHRIPSQGLRMWLRHQAHITLGKPVSTGPLTEAMATLQALAIFEGERRVMFNRVGGSTLSFEIDLGRNDGSVVKISSDGWAVAPLAEHMFIRGAGFGELPLPVAGGPISDLQKLLGLDDLNFKLTLAFLINALKPKGPYFALLVEGEQGSGKSFFCHVIKSLIDPNVASRLRLPDNDRDLMIHAKEYWLLNYDNASGMKPDMSDALCSLATGGGIAVRQLYSDGDLHVMSYARPFVINGISGYASRPDLLERGIPLKLPPMPPGERATEDELTAKFEVLKPAILAALYDAAAMACRELNEVEPPRELRMADAARWITAAEPALGFERGAVINAIVEAQNRVFIERINDDMLMIELRKITARGPYTGYVSELFVRITNGTEPGMPRSPSRLSAMLERLRPAMAKAGLVVEWTRTNRGRKVTITDTQNGKNMEPF